ncbi:MAG: DedA family protein [Acetobacteraceae bacterium]|nr:DedA family protein [Acetobacteraceae bacterium]
MALAPSEGLAIEDFVHAALAFIRENQAWAAPMVFALAFGESLAVISLLLPATAILFAVSGLLGASGIPFWPCWVAAAAGAVLGDAVSYWIGFHFKHRLPAIWPLSRAPDLLVRGERFFARWGIAGVFAGRFFGPLRCAVPLVAGSCAMPQLPFQVANVASAMAWATGILSPGLIAGAVFL